MTTPYFYIIEHKESNKRYAGSRWRSGCNPLELLQDKGYLTHSNKVKNIIKEQGLGSFIVILTDTYCDGMHPYEYETKFLMANNCAESDDWLNAHNNNLMTYRTERYRTCMLNKYGVDDPSRSSLIIDRRKITSMKNFGVEHNFLINGYYDNVKCKIQEKYGVDNISQAEIIKDKKKQTSMKNYGVSSHTQTKEYREHLSIKAKEYRKNDPILKCPHCAKLIKGLGLYNRWHNDKCKSRSIVQ